MARPPRDISVERLVSFPLLTYSYVVVGLAESLCCMGAYLWVFTHRGVKISDIFLLDPRDEQWFSDADRIDPERGPAATGEFSPEEQETIVREVRPRSCISGCYLILGRDWCIGVWLQGVSSSVHTHLSVPQLPRSHYYSVLEY